MTKQEILDLATRGLFRLLALPEPWLQQPTRHFAASIRFGKPYYAIGREALQNESEGLFGIRFDHRH